MPAVDAVPSLRDFRDLWTAGAAPPVWREVLVDFDTPLSIFTRLDRGGSGFLLESVEGGEVWGRYSIMAAEVDETLTVQATRRGDLTAGLVGPRGAVNLRAEDPLAALREVLAPRSIGAAADAAGAPRAAMFAGLGAVAPPSPFRGGAVGFVSFDAIQHVAPVTLPPMTKGDDGLDAAFLLPSTWLVFDRLRSRLTLVADTWRRRHAEDSAAEAWRDAVRRLDALERAVRKPPRARPVKRARFAAAPFDVGDVEFERRVERAKEYIRAGDVIQVVLSRRREGQYTGDPLDVYRALRLINPSPYMFFLRIGGRALAGSSPEALVRVQRGKLTTRPIAGTRPRGATPEDDARLAADLLADEKERAEHVMLVDLGRNDLGRVAATGSVKVTDYMRVERYSHVMHLVSDVSAELAEGRDAYDAVRSVFPAGTLSGAPKIRAMQILSELEGRRRGAYGGLVGWFGIDGDADTCIAIRTVEFARKNRYRVQAGAGIVFDSVPEREAAETAAKSEGVMRALALAAAGLR